jgi:hypothetical protein
MTFTALPITSAGRFWPLGPFGIVSSRHAHVVQHCVQIAKELRREHARLNCLAEKRQKLSLREIQWAVCHIAIWPPREPDLRLVEFFDVQPLDTASIDFSLASSVA